MNIEEIRKLSDRELLIKTFGKTENIDAKLEIYMKKVNNVEEKQDNFVTKKALKIWLGTTGLLVSGIGLILKIAKVW